MKRFLLAVIMAWSLPTLAVDPPKLAKFGARVVSPDTTWVTVSSLWGSESRTCNGNIMIVNESTTKLYVGGSDGSSTKMVPICKTNCNLGFISVGTNPEQVYVASASGILTNAVHLVCGAY